MEMLYTELNNYKYKLEEKLVCFIPINVEKEIDTKYIKLNPCFFDKGSTLIIEKGYMWDGPSGPTIDTKDFMRGALIHDGLYQLIREGYLSMSCRKQADKILRKICIEDGMNKFRAWYVYTAVNRFAEWAAKPKTMNNNIIAISY